MTPVKTWTDCQAAGGALAGWLAGFTPCAKQAAAVLPSAAHGQARARRAPAAVLNEQSWIVILSSSPVPHPELEDAARPLLQALAGIQLQGQIALRILAETHSSEDGCSIENACLSAERAPGRVLIQQAVGHWIYLRQQAPG